MQDECLNSRYVYETALPVSRLVSSTAESIFSWHVEKLRLDRWKVVI